MSSRTMAVDFWITGGLSFLYFPIFLSVETARQIDEEVRAIVERNYKRARKLLTDNLDRLHAMSDALVRYETLDAEQIEGIMARREPVRLRIPTIGAAVVPVLRQVPVRVPTPTAYRRLRRSYRSLR